MAARRRQRERRRGRSGTGAWNGDRTGAWSTNGAGNGARSGFWAGLRGLVLLLGLGLRAAAEPGHVPLIGWSTDRSVFPPPAAAPALGGRLGEGRLLELLSPPLRRGPPTRLLFLMDQLSMDDFTLYGSALPNLQGALSGAGSWLVLGAVGGGAAGALPHTLPPALGAPDPQRGDPDPQRGDPDPQRGDPDPLRALNGSQPGLLVLRLPHSASSSLLTPREALARNDAVLGEVLGALREQGLPHSALLTALRPSRVPPPKSPPPAMGRGRSLLAHDPNPSPPPPHPPLAWPRPPAPPHILLWARNVSLTRGGQRLDLTTRTFGGGADVELGGEWDPQEARLELKYDDVFGETLRISFRFRSAWSPVSGRPWWSLWDLGVALGGALPGAHFRGGGALGAPSPLGWRCGELAAPGYFLFPAPPAGSGGGPPTGSGGVPPTGNGGSPPPPGTAPPDGLGVTFIDLQVQPFNVSGGVFGGASDCAGFVSGGLWMGLLSGGVLLGALLGGAGLLLRLRPMDRLDDPRGPPCPCRPMSERGFNPPPVPANE